MYTCVHTYLSTHARIHNTYTRASSHSRARTYTYTYAYTVFRVTSRAWGMGWSHLLSSSSLTSFNCRIVSCLDSCLVGLILSCTSLLLCAHLPSCFWTLHIALAHSAHTYANILLFWIQLLVQLIRTHTHAHTQWVLGSLQLYLSLNSPRTDLAYTCTIHIHIHVQIYTYTLRCYLVFVLGWSLIWPAACFILPSFLSYLFFLVWSVWSGPVLIFLFLSMPSYCPLPTGFILTFTCLALWTLFVPL